MYGGFPYLINLENSNGKNGITFNNIRFESRKFNVINIYFEFFSNLKHTI